MRKYEELLIFNQKLHTSINETQKDNSELKKKNQELQKSNELLSINYEKSELILSKMKAKVEVIQKKNNVAIFNIAPLRFQQLIISEIIEIGINTEMNFYFQKINDFLIYLLDKTNYEKINFFKIDVDNKSIEFQDIHKEYPIVILSSGLDLFLDLKFSMSDDFIEKVKKFSDFSVELEYPQIFFEKHFDIINSNHKPKFDDEQFKITVFITKIEATDWLNIVSIIKNAVSKSLSSEISRNFSTF